MARVVFLLGAGASAAAGVPMMAGFLDEAERILTREKLPPDSRDRIQSVFSMLRALRASSYYSHLDLDNLETAFAALEMLRLMGIELDGYARDEYEAAVGAMRHLIRVTIETRLAFPVVKHGQESAYVGYPIPYGDFGSLVARVGHRREKLESCVITFNYDLALDFVLSRAGIRPDYGLGSTKAGAYPLLKLHGSLNWVQCRCGEVWVWEMERYLSRFNWNSLYLRDLSTVRLELAQQMLKSRPKHCDQDELGEEPFIVPPTWNKTAHHQAIEGVWQRAARELSDAEYIYVIGYSLPPSDHFFRFLFALGTLGGARIKHFWVFDPSIQAVEPRYRELIGPGLAPRFRPIAKTFASAIPEIHSALAAEGLVMAD